ncbi:MAG: toxin-antitoxin system YwqK family antitoxin [Bacteroidales bacterium]|nr:toxin-antitoxin system YwqK family antitoxin [Bacteroidales bacterium]
MTTLFRTLILIFTLCVIHTTAQTVDYEQLERRDKIAYLKGSESPFTGKAFGYWDNGNKKKEINFVNGIREGVYRTWFKNGNKESIKFYKNNLLEGAIISWYENGQYERKVEFRQDKKHGNFQAFYENGQVKSEGQYVNNKKIGIHIGYYENGQKESNGNFIDGVENGIHTEWYINGVKFKELTYDNGTLVSEKQWSESGKELSADEIKLLKQQQQNGNLMQMWLQQQ